MNSSVTTKGLKYRPSRYKIVQRILQVLISDPEYQSNKTRGTLYFYVFSCRTFYADGYYLTCSMNHTVVVRPLYSMMLILYSEIFCFMTYICKWHKCEARKIKFKTLTSFIGFSTLLNKAKEMC